MLKVAIAGCGLIAVKKHIPAFLRLKGKADIAAICDLDEKAVKFTANKFNIKKTYTSFFNMLMNEQPDIVDICTPPKTHAELAIQAIESGSHVLLEKPMAVEVQDCDAMIDASLKYQKKICVMHNQIFNPAFIRARERYLKGEIGDFLGVNIFLSTPTDYMTSKKEHWAHRLPGGVLGETGPHLIYLALSFLKNVYDVDIHARKLFPEYPWSNYEDFRINLMAENGIGSAVLIYSSNQWAANIDIIGTKGKLEIDLEAQSVIKCNRPHLNPFSIGTSELSAISERLSTISSNSLSRILGRGMDAHANGIYKFVDALLEKKPSPVTSLEGKETVHIMKMMLEKLKCIS